MILILEFMNVVQCRYPSIFVIHDLVHTTMPVSLPHMADGGLILHSPPVRSQTYRTHSSRFGLLQSQSMANLSGRNYPMSLE